MTAVHEPIPAASIPAITYRQAVDLIVAASDALTLPFPYGIDEVPGTGILSVSFWTDLDVQSWTDFFGASAWDGARRKVIVHAHDWHGWTVQMTGQGMPSLVCPKCNGGYAHQLGCDDDPTVYVPVAMPTGDTANRDECARLYDEHHRLTTADVLTVDPDLTDDGRGNPGMAQLQRQPYASDQYLYAEAPERIQTQRDDETFAQIVSAVPNV